MTRHEEIQNACNDGVLTIPVYATLPKADITCLDYSPDMMAAAKRRAPKNIQFVQGDVGMLPFETLHSLYGRLSQLYDAVELSTVEGIACFSCRKGA